MKQRNQQQEQKGHFGTVALVYLLQDTERTIIPYLNKKETLARTTPSLNLTSAPNEETKEEEKEEITYYWDEPKVKDPGDGYRPGRFKHLDEAIRNTKNGKRQKIQEKLLPLWSIPLVTPLVSFKE